MRLVIKAVGLRPPTACTYFEKNTVNYYYLLTLKLK